MPSVLIRVTAEISVELPDTTTLDVAIERGRELAGDVTKIIKLANKTASYNAFEGELVSVWK